MYPTHKYIAELDGMKSHAIYHDVSGETAIIYGILLVAPGTLSKVPKTCSSIAVAGFDATGDEVITTVNSVLSIITLNHFINWQQQISGRSVSTLPTVPGHFLGIHRLRA